MPCSLVTEAAVIVTVACCGSNSTVWSVRSYSEVVVGPEFVIAVLIDRAAEAAKVEIIGISVSAAYC